MACLLPQDTHDLFEEGFVLWLYIPEEHRNIKVKKEELNLTQLQTALCKNYSESTDRLDAGLNQYCYFFLLSGKLPSSYVASLYTPLSKNLHKQIPTS